MGGGQPQARTLGPREAELVSWLEIERPATLSVDTIVEALDWSRPQVRRILAQLAKKGWLERTRRGHYEPLLAETGGVAVPNPWAALSGWTVAHYVGFASAAYELDLVPDRPGAVQVAVPVGTSRPRAWTELPVITIPLRSFSLDGTIEDELHGHPIRVASTEKVLLDAATRTARIGGVFGLARLADRALGRADWGEFARLAQGAIRGEPAARRLAATLELIGDEIPDELRQVAEVDGEASAIYLGSRNTHNRRGKLLEPWRVIANVSPEALREEIER
jgi:predicted transcriptional regulator of viral defense system